MVPWGRALGIPLNPTAANWKEKDVIERDHIMIRKVSCRIYIQLDGIWNIGIRYERITLCRASTKAGKYEP